MMIRKALIFDATNVAIRHFLANPACDENGNPIGAILGTLRMLRYMLQETKPDRVFFAWDGEGGSRRRRGTMAEYKAGRKPRLNRTIDETPGDSKENLGWQMAKLKAMLGSLGVAQLELPDIEADDTIGYLAGLLASSVKVVVSGDRDMWQLVGPTTTVYWPNKKVYIGPGEFLQHAPVLPENFVLYRALSGKGDTSDNIRGIKGLGEKTILKLFPLLAQSPITPTQFLADLEQLLALDESGGVEPKLKESEKRWYREVLAQSDLVVERVALMQLTSPEISAHAAAVIREIASAPPRFNLTGFKLALMNSSIQFTDQELFSAVREYQLRVESTSP